MAINTKTMVFMMTLLSGLSIHGMDRVKNCGMKTWNAITFDGVQHPKAAAFKNEQSNRISKYTVDNQVGITIEAAGALKKELEGCTDDEKITNYQSKLDTLKLWDIANMKYVVISRADVEKLKTELVGEDDTAKLADAQKRLADLATNNVIQSSYETLQQDAQNRLDTFNANYSNGSYRALLVSRCLTVASWMGLGASLYFPCDPKIRVGALSAAGATTATTLALRYKARRDVEKAMTEAQK